MRRSVVWMLVIGCTLALGGFAQAQNQILDTNFTFQDIQNSRFSFEAGVWFKSFDGNFTLDTSKKDTEVDLGSDLKIGDDDNFSGRIEVQPWLDHHFRVGYNIMDFSGYNGDTRALTIDGKPYGLHSKVSTDLSMDVLELGYRYDLFKGDNFVVAPEFQIDLVDFEIDIHDIPAAGVMTRSKEDQWIPLPMIGVRGEYSFHPRVSVFADIKGFTIGDTASVADIEAGAQINIVKNFSIDAGYRYLYIDFDISDVKGDLTIDGPFVAGKIQF